MGMNQRDRLKRTMIAAGDTAWFTLRELSDITAISEPCVSAQLRHLRRAGCILVKRLRESGSDFKVWEYSLKLGTIDRTRELVDAKNARDRSPAVREHNKFKKRRLCEISRRKAAR